MFHLFKQPKFPTSTFIIASISALITLPIIFLILNLIISTDLNQEKNQASDKYFLNQNESNDPLITKIPELKEILKGPVISSSDPRLGSDKSSINIVEFSDYSCKFCKKQEEVLKKIVRDFNGKVSLIWKDFPENNTRSSSFKLSLAARCASDQEKFWPYHDLLFANPDIKNINAYARQLSLDEKKFNNCMALDNKNKQKIKNNLEEGSALGITGIPYLYINGEELIGETSYEELKSIIENKLKK